LRLLILSAAGLLGALASVAAQSPPLGDASKPNVRPRERRISRLAPLRFEECAVVSESAIASAVGAAILERRGNAIDAAVATAFALAVVHPTAGNLGGGGFLVAWRPDGAATAFDFREQAPLASRPDIFLDDKGSYDSKRHHWSAVSVGVPGSVAGLHLAHERMGRLPWKETVQPAIELAAKGFRVSRGLKESIEEVLPSLQSYPASLAQFTRSGKAPSVGELFTQPDLARTLERIRDQGPGGFYTGETADLIVKEMERLGGLIRHDDLKRYRALERQPVRGAYRGFEVISMPPPSSGGVALLEMLNILEEYPLGELGFRGAREAHVLLEAMRRAYADRARFLGDADHGDVPVERLVSKEHAAELRRTISLRRASRSSPESFEWSREGTETTHLSVVDKDLMAVSLTTTLEQAFGSRIVVPGAGFLLNNEMGDFNPRAGLTTAEGLIGTPSNLVEPEKRMLSSMTPTIVTRDGKPLLVLGSPGGRTIINTVLEIIVNVIDHKMAIQDAIDAPRFHHQWLPDKVAAEPWCFSPDTRSILEAMGHRIEVSPSPQGSAMGIAISSEPGIGTTLEAGVDRRRPDTGAAGK
jgi:gamma-glutamyltranspeptidase/glutathione hydrolase